MRTFGTLMTTAAAICLLQMAFSENISFERGFAYIVFGGVGMLITHLAKKMEERQKIYKRWRAACPPPKNL